MKNYSRYSSSSKFKPRSVRRMEKNSKRNLVITGLVGVLVLFFLITWGLPAIIGGLSVFNVFKPKEEVKSVLEDPAIAPPVLNIPYEATNSAEIRISGYATADSKVEIYIDDELKTVAETSLDGDFKTDPIELSMGTNNIYGKTVESEDRKSLASKTIRVIYNNEKPKLEISEPGDGTKIKGGDKKVKVSGNTNPDSFVTVNGFAVIVNNEGNFTTSISINDGENKILVVATNPVGNSTQAERTITYDP